MIVKGRANNSDGIIDKRIRIELGLSHIRGYLIASFGSHRVIVKSNVKTSNFRYFINTI